MTTPKIMEQQEQASKNDLSNAVYDATMNLSHYQYPELALNAERAAIFDEIPTHIF